MQEPGRRTAAKVETQQPEAGVQLLSEDNLAGGMKAPREDKG